MVMLHGIDCSYDPLTDSEAAALKQHDIKIFGACLWTAAEAPSVRISNLRVAERAGLHTWGYLSLNGMGNGAYHVDQALRNFPRDLWDHFLFVAVDVELPGIYETDILEACHAVGLAGQKAVIYTNYNSWQNYVTPSNTSALAQLDVPLLNAFWDGDPDVDFSKYPFGGWRPDQVIGEQYTGGQYVQGQYADNAMFYEDRLNINKEDDTMGMTPNETADFRTIQRKLKTQANKIAMLERLMSCQLDFSRSLADRVNAIRCTVDGLLTILKQTGLISSNTILDGYQTEVNKMQLRFEMKFKALTHFMRNVRKSGYGE
ncbi:hypothetical protein LCGC14_0814100 [marine sediment metagenome]|uniref:Uncharacterized protein n=1 Tax=marine sediment metagenome TaxID=412755 RepID=A0A0F9Q630_9ZZZZ